MGKIWKTIASFFTQPGHMPFEMATRAVHISDIDPLANTLDRIEDKLRKIEDMHMYGYDQYEIVDIDARKYNGDYVVPWWQDDRCSAEVPVDFSRTQGEMDLIRRNRIMNRNLQWRRNRAKEDPGRRLDSFPRG